jgi:Na+/H+-dicarboxylate symporter
MRFRKCGVDEEASVELSLGATVNMDGTSPSGSMRHFIAQGNASNFRLK